ncbi:MAG: DNA repair protein RadC [Coprococcus sp.]
MKRMTMKEMSETERPYEKGMKYGISSLSDAELLAIIIRSGSKNNNALDVAYRVLDAHTIHKGIVGLNFLEEKELTKIEGVGRIKALQLMCLAEFSRRMSKALYKPFISFSSPASIADYFMENTRYLEQECVYVLLFDSKHHLLKDIKLTQGTVNQSLVSPRSIFIEALKSNAVFIILIHNHPSGDPTPSREDLILTKRIYEAGKLIDIELSDHIILGNKCYVSLAERGLLHETKSKQKS